MITEENLTRKRISHPNDRSLAEKSIEALNSGYVESQRSYRANKKKPITQKLHNTNGSDRKRFANDEVNFMNTTGRQSKVGPSSNNSMSLIEQISLGGNSDTIIPANF
jgi:hypothetical protein